MHRSIVAALLLSLAASPVLAQTKPAAADAAKPAGAVLKPGLWEIVTVNETAGSPVKRTVTARTCFTADDVGNLARILPQQREAGMKCESREAKAQGASATWRVVCAGKDSSLAGPGKMTLAPEAYSGQADLELKKAGAKPVKVEQKVSAKWIEACK